MSIDLVLHKNRVSGKKKENKEYFKKLKQKSSKELDENFHTLHEEVFETIDCIQCANCCKTTSPRLYPKDIESIAHILKLRPADVMEKYVVIDEDNDYVFKSSPCPFLDQDNYCKVYEARPKACREYPHTDRKNMLQILDLTYKNIEVCPAVFEIVERMKKLV